MTEKPLLARLMPLVQIVAITIFFALTILVWETSVWASGAGPAVIQVVGGRHWRWSGLRGNSGGWASDVLTSGWASLRHIYNLIYVCPLKIVITARLPDVHHP